MPPRPVIDRREIRLREAQLVKEGVGGGQSPFGDSRAKNFTNCENARDWLTPLRVHHAEKLAAIAGRTRTVTPTAR